MNSLLKKKAVIMARLVNWVHSVGGYRAKQEQIQQEGRENPQSTVQDWVDQSYTTTIKWENKM